MASPSEATKYVYCSECGRQIAEALFARGEGHGKHTKRKRKAVRRG